MTTRIATGIWRHVVSVMARSDKDIPVSSAKATLLDNLGISTVVAILGKVTGKVLLRLGGAIGKASVVTVVLLV